MTDHSELIERLEELGGTLGNPAARLIRDLIAERDAAHANADVETVAVPRGIIGFLLGEQPLKGVWFGDMHPDERGAFWWREYLRAMRKDTSQ